MQDRRAEPHSMLGKAWLIWERCLKVGLFPNQNVDQVPSRSDWLVMEGAEQAHNQTAEIGLGEILRGQELEIRQRAEEVLALQLDKIAKEYEVRSEGAN